MRPLLAGSPQADHGLAVIMWLIVASITCGAPLFVVGIIVVVYLAVSVREGGSQKPGQ